MERKLLRLPAVRDRVGLARSSIYRLVRLGQFPRPVAIGARARAWRSDQIEKWVNERRPA